MKFKKVNLDDLPKEKNYNLHIISKVINDLLKFTEYTN